MTLLLYFILHFDRLELLSDICEIILIPDQKQSSLSRALTPLITHRTGKHRECFFPINEGLPFHSYVRGVFRMCKNKYIINVWDYTQTTLDRPWFANPQRQPQEYRLSILGTVII